MFQVNLNEINPMSVYCERLDWCNSATAFIGRCTCTNQRKNYTNQFIRTLNYFIYSELNLCIQIALIAFTNNYKKNVNCPNQRRNFYDFIR